METGKKKKTNKQIFPNKHKKSYQTIALVGHKERKKKQEITKKKKYPSRLK